LASSTKDNWNVFSFNLSSFDEAPPPSGHPSEELKNAMIDQAESWLFRLRVKMWKAILKRNFDHESFSQKLKNKSTYRCYANSKEMWRSIGWAGKDPSDPAKWLFGVAGFRIWLIGKSIMRHELFHAIQDLTTGLFNKPCGGLKNKARNFVAELSAHFWGGPLVTTVVLGPAFALPYVVYYSMLYVSAAAGF
jgi:hypothetical protein